MKLSKDKHGYTLVEVLVSIAIFSVVMVALFQFMDSISKFYNRNNQEIVLQNEAQTLMAQLNNYIVDADAGVVSGQNSSEEGISYYICYKDKVERIRLDFSSNKLFLSEASVSSTIAEDTTIDNATRMKNALTLTYGDEALLAEYVKTFDITPYFDTSTNNYVNVNIVLEYPSSSKKYTVNQDIYLRNRVYEKSLNSTKKTESSTTVSSSSESDLDNITLAPIVVTEASVPDVNNESSTTQSTSSEASNRTGESYTFKIQGPKCDTNNALTGCVALSGKKADGSDASMAFNYSLNADGYFEYTYTMDPGVTLTGYVIYYWNMYSSVLGRSTYASEYSVTYVKN